MLILELSAIPTRPLREQDEICERGASNYRIIRSLEILTNCMLKVFISN